MDARLLGPSDAQRKAFAIIERRRHNIDALLIQRDGVGGYMPKLLPMTPVERYAYQRYSTLWNLMNFERILEAA